MRRNPYRIGIDARLTYYRQGGIAQYTQHLIRELARIDHANRYLILHNFRDRRNLAQPPTRRERPVRGGEGGRSPTQWPPNSLTGRCSWRSLCLFWSFVPTR